VLRLRIEDRPQGTALPCPYYLNATKIYPQFSEFVKNLRRAGEKQPKKYRKNRP